MSKKAPSSIASLIASGLFSRIRSAIRTLLTMTSTAATRPPSIRGTKRRLTTPRRQGVAGAAARAPRHDRADHLLLRLGEELDHPAERLGGVDRVQRREHEVPRFRSLERCLRGLGV